MRVVDHYKKRMQAQNPASNFDFIVAYHICLINFSACCDQHFNHRDIPVGHGFMERGALTLCIDTCKIKRTTTKNYITNLENFDKGTKVILPGLQLLLHYRHLLWSQCVQT